MDNKLEILEKSFKIEEYQKFCMQFLNLNKDDLVLLKEQKVGYPVYRDYVYNYHKIAEYTDNDDKTMVVLAVKLINSKSAERARSMQRSYIARLLEDFSIDAALVAFYSDEETSWRLSFVGLDYEFSAEGLKKKVTPAKRYSYLVGENEPNHTAREQLRDIYLDDNNNPSIKEIEEAFKIEKVTKRFFDEYKDKYLKLKEFLDADDNFMKESESLGFTSEEFSKKLMGQLAFLYFIQKKGWLGVKAVPHEIKYSEYLKVYDKQNETVRNVLSKVFLRDNANMKLSYSGIKNISDIEGDYLAGVFTSYVDETEADWGQWGSGNKRFIRELFNICTNSKTEKNFFNDYLEPLFYSALNEKRGANEYFKLFNCKIPFLNGGLFESIYEYKDNKIDVKIPNEMFSNKKDDDDFGSGILDVFDTYNFTMNEDEPLEKEVAIDPEMLGKIFENLLDVKDRKSKGAFYTPREIVHYMCQESLINYLHNEIRIDKEDIENFIRLGDFIVDEDSRLINQNSKGKEEYLIPTSIYDNLIKFDDALKNVKVADPAVGSGAFPLGMLNEIVRIRSYLTLYMTQGLNKDDKLDLERSRSNYKLKEHVMKYVIHAVDIERSAVDITKLRLWLSLIVDADMRTVNALPNLDSNIKCGNSLIDEFEGVKLFDEDLFEVSDNNSNSTQMVIKDVEEKELIDKLEKLQKELFDAKEPDKKKEIKEFIDETEWKLIEYKLKKDDNEDKIEELKFLKKEQRKPYFLWQMEFSDVFREKGGFDIVIGNPPYVGEEGNKDLFRNVANTRFGKKYYKGKMDLWYFFTSKGIELLKLNGIISYIAPNNWMTTAGGSKMRKHITEEATIKRFITFKNLMVFENASQQTMIFVLKKSVDEEHYSFDYSEFDDKYYRGSEYSNDFLINKKTGIHFKTQVDRKSCQGGQIIQFLNSAIAKLIDKIKNVEHLLLQNDEITNAIHPHHASVTKKMLGELKDCSIGDGIFVLTQEEVDNLMLSENEKTLLKHCYDSRNIGRYKFDKKGSKWMIYTTSDFKDIKKIESYPNIKRHLDKYVSVITSDNRPYGLHRARKQEFFELEKIVSLRKCKLPTFMYIKERAYVMAEYNVIRTERIDMLYLLGILNSRLVTFWLRYMGKMQGNIYQVDKEPLVNIPIVIPSKEKSAEIAILVSKIINGYQLNIYTASIENEIDKMVYELYGIDPEEIKIIEEV